MGLVLFLVYLLSSLVPDVQQARNDLDELDEVRAEKTVLVRELDSRVDVLHTTAEATEQKLEGQVSGLRAAVDDRVRTAKAVCGVLAKLERILPGPDRCKEAK